ncbi:MAG: hypothetical protein COV46_07505 [Deltaproteobacteria bacterium CG11_big_fil_rev_8_21_14_0_20_49_13]|nr:MAG: hypothetical protein COV46_07505 [Deltaproteobacteria bacterium CG11_big_fil_rev_8_21_14_0_20_49_13]
MKRKIFSIFGLVCIVAFFLPWLKACDRVGSGFELLILDSIKSFATSSLSSLNTGLLLLLVPLYAIIVAWLLRPEHCTRSFKFLFGFLALLSVWNSGIWGGLVISALKEEFGTTSHIHAMKMARLSAIAIIGAIALIVFLVRWLRTKKFNWGWSLAVLIIPIFPALGIGFTMKPNFYGLWIYTGALIVLFIGAVWDGIKPYANPSELHD